MRKLFPIFLSFIFLVAILCGNAWAPDPSIDLEKYVSVDGGQTWFDADSPDLAPPASVGEEVKYKFIVTNTGNTPLTNVIINDPTLGIVDYPVGDLAVSESVVLDEGDIAELNQPNRCESPGEFQNIASVDAEFDGIMVSDSDPAWVKCTELPCIDIEKLVSMDGGLTWHDADTEAEAVETEVGQGVQYKLIVHNCGSVDLVNVTINDPTLGIVDYPVGDLAVSESVVLDEGDIAELNQPERCSEAGKFQNVASVIGISEAGAQVTDSDPAWVSCVRRGNEGCTPGFWKQDQHFVYWTGYIPEDLFSAVFGRTITINWSITGKPQPVTNPTLLQALEANGGGINALARHSVAALLNAANPDVEYFYSTSEIIEMFQDAFDSDDYEYTKDIFKEENESGCPLKDAENDVYPGT